MVFSRKESINDEVSEVPTNMQIKKYKLIVTYCIPVPNCRNQNPKAVPFNEIIFSDSEKQFRNRKSGAIQGYKKNKPLIHN